MHAPTNAYQGGEIPPIVIRPLRKWGPINFEELLSYRELLYLFVWRDIKSRANFFVARGLVPRLLIPRPHLRLNSTFDFRRLTFICRGVVYCARVFLL